MSLTLAIVRRQSEQMDSQVPSAFLRWGNVRTEDSIKAGPSLFTVDAQTTPILTFWDWESGLASKVPRPRSKESKTIQSPDWSQRYCVFHD